MTADARFHVVVPTYERPALLRETLASAVAQDAPGVAVTVADNASGPETARVVAEFGARVVHRRFDEHVPYQGNLTRAKDLVAAPHGLVLHDDDLLDRDYAATALDAFARHPDVAAVIVAARPLAADGAVAPPFASTYRWALALGLGAPREGPSGPEALLPPGALLRGLSATPWMCPYWPTVSLRTDAYRAAGPYDLGLGMLVDTDQWMRIGARHAVLAIDAVRCSYRFHAASKTTEYARTDVVVRDVLRILDKVRSGEAGWTWTDEQAARWLSFAVEPAVPRGDAACREQYERWDLQRYGVPLRELVRQQLAARLLWRRTVAPDRGLLGAVADLRTRVRLWRASR